MILYIVLLYGPTLSQMHSGMARAVKESQFYRPPTCLSTNGMNYTCLSLCLPSRSWSSFTDPGRMDGWVGLGTITVSKSLPRIDTWCKSQLSAAQPITPHHASGNAAGYERWTYDLTGRKPQMQTTESPNTLGLLCHCYRTYRGHRNIFISWGKRCLPFYEGSEINIYPSSHTAHKSTSDLTLWCPSKFLCLTQFL